MPVTVIDVFRELRIEPEKKKTWAVGQLVVNQYKKEFGSLPPKDLRTKTCGVGVHCFAIYPDHYRHTIRDCINKIETIEARQQQLL